MANLAPVIKLRQRAVETIRVELARLREAQDRLTARGQALQAQLQQEHQATGADARMAFALSGFALGVERERQRIAVEQDNLETAIGEMTDNLAQAFRELKAVEAVAEKRAEHQARARARRETEQLDEIALDRFRRDQPAG